MVTRHALWLCGRISDSRSGADGLRVVLVWASTKPTAPIRHPISWETCSEGIGAAGEEKGLVVDAYGK